MKEKLVKIGAFVAVAGMALTGIAVELDLAGEWQGEWLLPELNGSLLL